MSYGIPSISSKQVMENFDLIKSKKITFYKNKKELIALILKLKKNKNFSNSESKKGLVVIKNFKWDKVLKVLKNVFN